MSSFVSITGLAIGERIERKKVNMTEEEGCSNEIAAPHDERLTPDGYLTTLHPKGSFNDFQFDIEKRELVRPEINYGEAVINVLIPLTICLLVCWWNVLYALIALGLYIVIRLHQIIIWCIHVYQRYASDDIRLACVFEPSCSEYMILSVKKYGAVWGVVKGIKRLLRCHSPNGGEDYP